MSQNFSHFDDKGDAIMVDVSLKDKTFREATAVGHIIVNQEIINHIINKSIKKGDVLQVARLAGIMACKRTSELIPLCHPLMLTHSSIEFEILKEEQSIKASCKVRVTGETGVEMEALHGVSTALLTIYDMCKGVDKSLKIKDIYLEEKIGGKSGHYKNK